MELSMIDKVRLEAYLAKVTQRFSVREAHAILAKFMCRCLLLVQHILPEVGRNALNVAKVFWLEGGGQAEALLAARVECWKYLDEKNGSTNIQDLEDKAMRALICVLYAEPEDDEFSVETVRWFFDLFNQIGNYSDETIHYMDI